MFLLTFCRYSMTHGDEFVGGVGEVAVEVGPEVATETAVEGGTEGVSVEVTEGASEEATDLGVTEQVTHEAA